jgi:GT2 family glycosyltransferase
LKLSIIIVNYRSWSFLDECLSSLIADPDSKDWQIIVVDNHSNDGQFESFKQKYTQIEFVAQQRNGGFAYGCNAGVLKVSNEAEARCRLLFLNPDVVVEAGQIGALSAIKDKFPEVAILTATQVNGKGQAQKTWDIFPDLLTYLKSVKSALRVLMPGRFPDPRATLQGLVYCDWVSGAVFMIDGDHFNELGGWCEDYWLYSEDCDLCFLAGQKGYRVACTPEVTFLHHHGGASRQTREITALTKTEAIISKHVFNHRHRRGWRKVLNHSLIMLANIPELAFWSLLDNLTFRRFRVLTVRRNMFIQLLSHYGKVRRSGSWCSARTEV